MIYTVKPGEFCLAMKYLFQKAVDGDVLLVSNPMQLHAAELTKIDYAPNKKIDLQSLN
jgi:hypothetical protein